MKQLKKFKFSLPNSGLMFLIAGMAVANYSYDNYQRKYMSSSKGQSVDSTAKEILHQDFVANSFVPYHDYDALKENKKFRSKNISIDGDSDSKPDQMPIADNFPREDNIANIASESVNPEQSVDVNSSSSKSASLKKRNGKKDKYIKTNYI